MSKINELMKMYDAKYKDFYKKINKYFVKNKDFEWNNKCYVPIAATIALLSEGSSDIFVIKSILKDAGITASLCGWKANEKKIVKVDTSVKNDIYYERLINTNDIFKKIGYGTYLEINLEEFGIEGETDGVLTSIEYDINEKRLELRANVVFKDKSIQPFILHLLDNRSLIECIEDTLRFTNEKIREDIKNNKINKIEMLYTLKSTDQIYLLNYLIFSIMLFVIDNM